MGAARQLRRRLREAESGGDGSRNGSRGGSRGDSRVPGVDLRGGESRAGDGGGGGGRRRLGRGARSRCGSDGDSDGSGGGGEGAASGSESSADSSAGDAGAGLAGCRRRPLYELLLSSSSDSGEEGGGGGGGSGGSGRFRRRPSPAARIAAAGTAGARRLPGARRRSGGAAAAAAARNTRLRGRRSSTAAAAVAGATGAAAAGASGGAGAGDGSDSVAGGACGGDSVAPSDGSGEAPAAEAGTAAAAPLFLSLTPAAFLAGGGAEAPGGGGGGRGFSALRKRWLVPDGADEVGGAVVAPEEAFEMHRCDDAGSAGGGGGGAGGGSAGGGRGGSRFCNSPTSCGGGAVASGGAAVSGSIFYFSPSPAYESTRAELATLLINRFVSFDVLSEFLEKYPCHVEGNLVLALMLLRHGAAEPEAALRCMRRACHGLQSRFDPRFSPFGPEAPRLALLPRTHRFKPTFLAVLALYAQLLQGVGNHAAAAAVARVLVMTEVAPAPAAELTTKLATKWAASSASSASPALLAAEAVNPTAALAAKPAARAKAVPEAEVNPVPTGVSAEAEPKANSREPSAELRETAAQGRAPEAASTASTTAGILTEPPAAPPTSSLPPAAAPLSPLARPLAPPPVSPPSPPLLTLVANDDARGFLALPLSLAYIKDVDELARVSRRLHATGVAVGGRRGLFGADAAFAAYAFALPAARHRRLPLAAKCAYVNNIDAVQIRPEKYCCLEEWGSGEGSRPKFLAREGYWDGVPAAVPAAPATAESYTPATAAGGGGAATGAPADKKLAQLGLMRALVLFPKFLPLFAEHCGLSLDGKPAGSRGAYTWRELLRSDLMRPPYVEGGVRATGLSSKAFSLLQQQLVECMAGGFARLWQPHVVYMHEAACILVAQHARPADRETIAGFRRLWCRCAAAAEAAHGFLAKYGDCSEAEFLAPGGAGLGYELPAELRMSLDIFRDAGALTGRPVRYHMLGLRRGAHRPPALWVSLESAPLVVFLQLFVPFSALDLKGTRAHPVGVLGAGAAAAAAAAGAAAGAAGSLAAALARVLAAAVRAARSLPQRLREKG